MTQRNIPTVITGEVVAPLQMWLTFPISEGLETATGRIINVAHNGHDVIVSVQSVYGEETMRVRFPLETLVDAVFASEDFIRAVQTDDEATMQRLRDDGVSPIDYATWKEAHTNRPV